MRIDAAKIRKCPRCSKSTIKSEGCNKITCGCGAKFCYVCRTSIKNYEHFCQTPHCNHQSCRKCPLYSTDEQDEQAMRVAGQAAVARSGAAAEKVDIDKLIK